MTDNIARWSHLKSWRFWAALIPTLCIGAAAVVCALFLILGRAANAVDDRLNDAIKKIILWTYGGRHD